MIYNWAYTHRARKRESTVCPRIVPKNYCYLLALFDLVMVHYHLIPLFGKQKSENNKTALFNSEKPWISIEFTSSNLILKVVWQNPGEEMIIAVSDRTPASNVFKIVVAVQLLSHVQLFVTPGTAACQACLSFTVSRSVLKLMSIESVMPSNHFIPCRPLFLLPSIFPIIRVFSNVSVVCIRWQSIGASASASVFPMTIQDWFSLGCTGWISLQSKRLSWDFPNTTFQKHQFFGVQFSLCSKSHILTWLLEKP